MDTYDTDLLQMFVAESFDMIDEVEPVLIGFAHQEEESGTASIDDVNFVFRLFHSIKGSSGFLQLSNITELTHEAETLLDLVRKEQIVLTSDVSKLLVRACDQLRVLLETVGDTLSDAGHESDTQLIIRDVLETIAREKKPGVEKEDKNAEPRWPLEPADQSVQTEAVKADAIINGGATDGGSCDAVGSLAAQSSNPVISEDMIKIFIQDSEDVLDQMERALMEQVGSPDDANAMPTVFRLVHTFKGNCGFMSFEDLVQLSHKVEEVLQGIREKKIEMSDSLVQIILKLVDVFRQSVVDISEGGTGTVLGKAGLIDLMDEFIPAQDEKQPEFKRAPVLEIRETAPADKGGGTSSGRAVSRTQKSIRVNVDKLDHLNNLVGELIISEAMVTNSKDLKGLKLDNFRRSAHRLNLITSELQDLSMSLRMVPIETTLKKLIRLSHDVSSKTGKKVDLTLLGTDTEVDRTVGELIADPLVHIVRNSIDHGVELPEERLAAGKPAIGKVVVEAKHQAGEVWIVISDDGKGLDADEIRQRAIDRGLLKEENVGRYSPEEIYEFIFEPGFSTASVVTDVSGRGVGMDVVRKNIEKLNGRVEIASQIGKGTVMTIRIPLTLAIINGMVVRIGAESYIIPLLSIKESFRPVADMVNTVTAKGETIYLRGELMPLYRLARLFEVADAEELPEKGIVVVIETSGRKTALLVDELLGQQQTVIKSLGEALRGVKGLAGASIMSDGRVALIVDIDGLIKLASG